ncbi:DUF397 domain-containing protein [Nocardiopsis sp. NPDC050513]|uniref:DUF397 domain-containing protein n=1 Tax=Nocardiopsis sp. NPDC050513 TaxID=3364338 RepID=UPI00379D110C
MHSSTDLNGWRTSSYTQQQNCVEVADLPFRRSSYSTGRGQDCVEDANLPVGMAIRDTKHRHLGHLELPAVEWTALLGAVRVRPTVKRSGRARYILPRCRQ